MLFDVSFYMQSTFDTVEFGKIDYSQTIPKDSGVGRVFSVDIDFYSDSSMSESFQFNTFIIGGQ